MRLRILVRALPVLIGLLALTAPAGAIEFLWTNDGDFGAFDNGDVLAYDTLTGTNSVFASQAAIFGGEEVIDAVSLLPDGHIVLSTENGASIGGFSFGDEHLVDYDPVAGTAVSFLDMSSLFSANEDVDAVHVIDADQLLFSTTTSATLLASNGDLDFDDDDVVLYNRTTGEASIFFDGSAVFDSAEDVVAISLTSSGRLLISTDGSASIGGVAFEDSAVVKIDVATGALLRTVIDLEGLPGGTQDVRAFHLVAEPPGAALLLAALGAIALPRRLR
jgi:hypothetical protein